MVQISIDSTKALEERQSITRDGVSTTVDHKEAKRTQHVPFDGSEHEFVSASDRQKDKMLELRQTLDDFMAHGLQDFPALLTFTTKREDEEDCFEIEESWRTFADKSKLRELSKKQIDLQDAIWKIITTEVAYIKDIRVIIDLYLGTLVNLQGAILLNEIETEKIFGNISTIETLHTRFWREKLSSVVNKAREEKRLLSATDVAEAFQGFSSFLNPYIRFCTDTHRRMEYLNEQIKTNEMFGLFTEWACRHPKSRGLKLPDLLCLPVERITEYPVLFSTVEKSLGDNDQTPVSKQVGLSPKLKCLPCL